MATECHNKAVNKSQLSLLKLPLKDLFVNYKFEKYWFCYCLTVRLWALSKETPFILRCLSVHQHWTLTEYPNGSEDIRLYFSGNRGIWFKETSLTPINTIEDFELNGDRPLETIAVDDGLEIVALGLDALMEKACNQVRGYLKNSSRVDEKDRDLCDGIGDEEIE